MATRLLPPGYQEFTPAGAIAAGAKLYTYSAGTSTPKATYSDAALTVANANPVIADASGRFGDVFAGTGEYRLRMETAASALLWTADPVDGASATSSGTSETNLLVNGDFRIGSLLRDNDVQYFTDGQPISDGWLLLAQTGICQVAQESTVSSRWASNAVRITNQAGSAQRLGLVQWVEPDDVAHLAAQAVALGGTVYSSVSQTIRYAVLQWSSYPTAIPLDPVNNWTSTNYTGGNFFVTGITVVASGSITPAGAVYTDLPFVTGTCGSNPQALAVMVWTEATLANGANIRLTNMRLNQGATLAAFERRLYRNEKIAALPDPFLAQRNLLTNGDFNVWQAGTTVAIPASTTTSACYGPDRWCMETGALQACTISRIAAESDTERTYYRARYGVKVQRDAGQTGTGVLRFQQPLETADLWSIRNRQVTVSFFLGIGADFAGSLSVKLLMGTGTEGRRTNAASYTGETAVISQALTVAAGNEGYHFAFTSAGFGGDIPSGVGEFTQASLVFEWTPAGTAGTNDWFALSSVRLHIGDAPAPFVAENIADTLARCQRWFAKSFPLDTAPAQNAGLTGAVIWPQVVGASAAQRLGSIPFPARMRAAPTITLFNPSAANGQVRNADVPVDCSVSSATGTEWGFDAVTTTGAGSAAGQRLAVHFTADARL